MQIINEARKDINKIWGKQSVKDTQYRPLKYLLEVPVEEGLLVHNVVSGELILLEGEEIDQFKSEHIKPVSALADDAGADIPDETDVIAELIGKHFLVPLDFDEHASVLNLRKILRLLDNDKSITGYTILPTTYCNARCFYCYEAGMEHIHMTDETADQVVEFIAKNHGDHQISIEWFGGEPLIGSKIIGRICQGLRDKNIEFVSKMTSNGYLFDEDQIQIAKDDWNLKSIQITLDGTEEIYNRVKDYQGVKDNPYKRVMRNIQLLLNADIRVVVRMNLDYHNYDDLESLSKELCDRFSGYSNFNSYVHTVMEDEGFDIIIHAEYEHIDLLERDYYLNKVLQSFGIQHENSVLPSLKLNKCMADGKDNIIIYPDGSLSKCEHQIRDFVGNLTDGVTDTNKIDKWEESSEYDECKFCRLFPNCIELTMCKSETRCYKIHKTKKFDYATFTIGGLYRYLIVRKEKKHE